MITFTPLSGAANVSRTVPLSYVLQVDDVRILLDCGSPDWNPESVALDADGEPNYEWEEYCQALRDMAPSIDLVLLSHGDLAHVGLFPYACSRWNLKAPTYSTLPVQAMGRIAVTEDVDGIRDEQDIGDEGPQLLAEPDSMELDTEQPNPEPVMPKTKGKYIATSVEVQEAFDSVNTLRYSQPTHLQGKCQGLTITPFNAGHTLGGTIWKIRSPSSGTILYSVNINHMKEQHLDGTVLKTAGGIFEPLARPDLLITDAERVSVITSRRTDRNEAFIDTVTGALHSRHSILIPCDSSTRVLELLVLLDQTWNFSKLRYPICFLSKTANEMLTFVRSMMEWFGGTISKEDVGEDGTGGNRHEKRRRRADDDDEETALGAFALRFPHLEFFPNPQSLIQKYPSKDPKLILAVPATLSHGPSRSLFCDFASIPDNVILLTGRSEEGTLGRLLFDKWDARQRPEKKWDSGRIGDSFMMDESLRLTMHSKVPLQGPELDAHLQKEREEKEKEAAQQAALARSRLMLEADEDDSDSDSDSDLSDEDEVEQSLMDGETTGSRRRREKGGDDWNMDVDEGLTRQLLSFDIYLKGNVSKATSFFKTVGGQTNRFRMFPYVERKRRVDEYGETIDVGMWLRKGKVLEEEAETEEMKDYKRKQAEKDVQGTLEEPPSKYVTTEVNVQLACRLLFIDLEGLNDGRAVKMIVPQVSPRKMIIVHASEESTKALIESCGNIRAMTKDIYAPTPGDSIQIGQQINSFSISISDELLASIKMSRFEENEVGYVSGRVVSHSNSIVPTLEIMHSSAQNLNAEVPASIPRMPGSRPPVALPNYTMIGELKLTALKARLMSIGIQAELVGEGVLICGSGNYGASLDALEEPIAVRKTAGGKVELEGNISEVYYTVRREIYKMHAVVAA